MMGVAAGLSTMGLVPFASTFAMFAAGRAFEQIRNTIGYPHLNVKIGATHGGISVGEDGASHQCCEDFGLMRTIPGMVVMCPADDVEAAAMVKAAYEYGPGVYALRPAGRPVFHDPGQYTFQIGKGELLRDGADVAILANGLMVHEALDAADALAETGIHARVINLATIKPLDEEMVSRPPGTAGRSSPWRNTTSSAVWARPSAPAWRALPGPCEADRRRGHLRPLRPRRGPAAPVRPVRGAHRPGYPGVRRKVTRLKSRFL